MNKKNKNMSLILSIITASICLTLTACSAQNFNSTESGSKSDIINNGLIIQQPGNSIPPNQILIPPKTQKHYDTDAMIFAGTGTWAAEISSIEDLLQSHNATYKKVTSDELNNMSLEDITKFGVLIFPGGQGSTQAQSLTSETHARLRQAVQQKGVSYLGFCAGSFIAQAPAPAPGQDVSYGLGIIDGPILDYYYLENQGKDISMTLLTFPDGSTKDVLWYGGPVTPNIPGGVIAKYPDGSPSISEIWSGIGLVILSGGHPTATQNILDSLGVTSSDGTHLELVWSLFQAALFQKPIQAF